MDKVRINMREIKFEENTDFYDKWKGYVQTEGSIRFYPDLQMFVNWKNNGEEIKGLLISRGISISKRVVGENHYFKEGISWALRTAIFQPHLIPKGYIFTSGRSIAVFNTQDDKRYKVSTCFNSITIYSYL